MTDETPSPVSAGPILKSPWEERSKERETFGIKLQKLEVTSNLSVTRANEAKDALSASNNKLNFTANSAIKRDHNKDSPTRASFIEPTSFSGVKVALATPDNEEEEKNADGTAMRLELTEPLPILPKVTTVIHMPVKCPIENVRFVNLKRFL